MSVVPEGITSADVIVLALLSAEQHSRLLEIASKSPVLRTRTAEINIRTRNDGAFGSRKSWAQAREDITTT